MYRCASVWCLYQLPVYGWHIIMHCYNVLLNLSSFFNYMIGFCVRMSLHVVCRGCCPYGRWCTIQIFFIVVCPVQISLLLLLYILYKSHYYCCTSCTNLIIVVVHPVQISFIIVTVVCPVEISVVVVHPVQISFIIVVHPVQISFIIIVVHPVQIFIIVVVVCPVEISFIFVVVCLGLCDAGQQHLGENHDLQAGGGGAQRERCLHRGNTNS